MHTHDSYMNGMHAHYKYCTYECTYIHTYIPMCTHVCTHMCTCIHYMYNSTRGIVLASYTLIIHYTNSDCLQTKCILQFDWHCSMRSTTHPMELLTRKNDSLAANKFLIYFSMIILLKDHIPHMYSTAWHSGMIWW